MSHRIAVAALTLGLAVGMLAAAGCGVPTEQAPRPVAASAPSELLAPAPRTVPQPTQVRATPNAQVPQVYFVDDRDRLVGLPQPMRIGSVRADLDALMRTLTAGLTGAERARGLSSALPPGLTLTVDDVHAGRVTVDLSGDVPGPSGDQTVLAVAQIVLSATSIPTVTGVQLTRAGNPLDAPLVGGALTSVPLSRSDYRSLLR
ncbi:MAG TPA: GerMN domain-containing protein [Mycobacteriales bacterium]